MVCVYVCFDPTKKMLSATPANGNTKWKNAKKLALILHKKKTERKHTHTTSVHFSISGKIHTRGIRIVISMTFPMWKRGKFQQNIQILACIHIYQCKHWKWRKGKKYWKRRWDRMGEWKWAVHFLVGRKFMVENDSVSCWLRFIVVGSCDIAILNSNTFLSDVIVVSECLWCSVTLSPSPSLLFFHLFVFVLAPVCVYQLFQAFDRASFGGYAKI